MEIEAGRHSDLVVTRFAEWFNGKKGKLIHISVTKEGTGEFGDIEPSRWRLLIAMQPKATTAFSPCCARAVGGRWLLRC